MVAIGFLTYLGGLENIPPRNRSKTDGSLTREGWVEQVAKRFPIVSQRLRRLSPVRRKPPPCLDRPERTSLPLAWQRKLEADWEGDLTPHSPQCASCTRSKIDVVLDIQDASCGRTTSRRSDDFTHAPAGSSLCAQSGGLHMKCKFGERTRSAK